ncbi:MAG TPA: DJ-1/PfpI family protein, partial [Candidatus Aenigmarchaeota archaeon]|nr:DJ-1/PfpI family protein [Candidatus Aenigmarchaeota archaeon]
IVLPGGDPGYKNLMKSHDILMLVKKFYENGKLVGAICAAPLVLAKAGVLDNKLATIYPGMERDIPRPRDASVIVDGNVITSKGPGTAIEFALAIVEYLLGKAKAIELKNIIVA